MPCSPKVRRAMTEEPACFARCRSLVGTLKGRTAGLFSFRSWLLCNCSIVLALRVSQGQFARECLGEEERSRLRLSLPLSRIFRDRGYAACASGLPRTPAPTNGFTGFVSAESANPVAGGSREVQSVSLGRSVVILGCGAAVLWGSWAPGVHAMPGLAFR